MATWLWLAIHEVYHFRIIRIFQAPGMVPNLAEVGGDLSFDIPKPRVEPTVMFLWTVPTFWIFLDAFRTGMFDTFDMFEYVYGCLWMFMVMKHECYIYVYYVCHIMTAGRFQTIPELFQKCTDHHSLQMSSSHFKHVNLPPFHGQIPRSQIPDPLGILSKARALLEKMDAMFSWDLGISETCLDVWDQEHI